MAKNGAGMCIVFGCLNEFRHWSQALLKIKSTTTIRKQSWTDINSHLFSTRDDNGARRGWIRGQRMKRN